MLFLSYGHRDATELALRLRDDLEAAGYSVWQDERRIRAGSAWTDEIRQGLRESDLVVALLSPHSVRRKGWDANASDQDSVCLDEIEYAVDACKIPVLPVMAVSCEPPFRIYRLQYLDFRAWEESSARYDELKETLITAVGECLKNGRAPLRKWERLPEPWDFTAFLAERRRRFVGRRWLFDDLRDRVTNTSSSVVLLTGSPGIGKSAFFASLVHANPGGQILAYHCCQATTPATLSPAVFVRSIASMIAARDASYAGLLEHPDTLAALNEANVAKDPASAFEALILNLLNKLPEPETAPRLLAIDALDEALTSPESPNLIELLSNRLGALPAWLKIVATTRDEWAVKRRFSTANLLSLDEAKDDNKEDLTAYISTRMELEPLRTRVAAKRDEISGKVLERGTDNFLVVAQTLDAIESGLIDADDLDTLAPGLYPLYESFFDRLFKRAGVDFTPSRTLLQCLLAAREPPTRDDLATVTGLDAESDLEPMLDRLSSMIQPRDKHYSPYHKTLTEWLTGRNAEDRALAGPYFISTRKGHQLWAEALLRRYAKGSKAWDLYLRRHLPIHLAGAEQWDEVATVLLDLNFLEAKVRGPGTTVFDLVADFESALRGMPHDHEKFHLIFLITEILRLDAVFLASFPDSLFQCLWNRGYWHDCANAKAFFSSSDASRAPWEGGEPRLSALVEQWRIDKQTSSPGHTWLRALRPMTEVLGGALRSIIRADSDSFDGVTVSPDGSRILATMSGNGLLGVWDARSSAQLAIADFSDEKSVHCVRFLPNGPRIGFAAAVTWDGRLILLDHALEIVEEVKGTEDNFGRVAVSPDGNVIATGDWKGVVALWASDTMSLLRRWQAHENQIKALEFSPCGKFLASGEMEYFGSNEVRVWGVYESVAHPLAEAKAKSWVECVCFSSDSQTLYWGDYDGAIERWKWSTGEQSLIRDQHDSPASVICLFGKNQMLCGVGGAFDPAPIEVWNLEEGRIEQKLDGHLFGIGDLALIPETQRFVSAGDSTLRIWDLGLPDAIRLTMFEPDVDWVTFREPQGWAITATETSDTVWVRTLLDGTMVMKLEGHGENVSAIALSHDGRWLACGVADGSVRLWDLESGKPQWQTKHHDAKVSVIAFFPDDRMLATGSDDGRVNLIATEDGEYIRHSKAHRDDSISCLAVSNNGRLVASGGYSNLEILNADNLKVARKLKHETHYALWFAPGDEFVVGEGMSQFGLAWEVSTGKPPSDSEKIRSLYDSAMLRAGRRWQWHSPGNIGYAQEYLKLVDSTSGAVVAAFPELQGEVRWHPGGRIWVNKRSRRVSLVQFEGP